MQNADICIREKDIVVKYGLFDLTRGKEPSEMAMASFRYILSDINDIRTQYVRLGFHLNECKRMKYYEHFGYLDFNEFVENNFGLDKSACSRCMNVAQRFCKNIEGTLGKTMFIDDRFKDYSYSQLVEMLPLSDNDIVKVKPSMTINQIRDIKKSSKPGKKEKVATSQLENCISLGAMDSKKGIVLQNYIKNAESLDVKHLVLFDADCRKRIYYLTCDVLLSESNTLVLRAVPDDLCPGNSDCFIGNCGNADPLHKEDTE